jgi:hypothetical protein
MIAPVVALILWSLVIWVWMYATRLPAMQTGGVKPQEGAFAGAVNARMPPWARRVADNYNHLMEQPTIFYAVCFALELLHRSQPINIGLGWSYVAARVAHSLVQCTFNNVPLRFFVFVISTLALALLALDAAIGVGFIPDILPY